jgi:mRNA interferase MazF
VIVSDYRANSVAARLGRGIVTAGWSQWYRSPAIPTASNTDRGFPFHALFPAAATGLPQDSKEAHAEHVRSITFERLGQLPSRGVLDEVASQSLPPRCAQWPAASMPRMIVATCS